MRILHINTERTWRGGEQQTLYLARGLKQRGHESTIACPPASPLALHARQENLDVAEVRMRGECDPVAMYKLARLIRMRGYDIVHMHTSHAHTLGCFASQLARQGARIVTRRVAFPTRKHPLSRLKYRYGVDRFVTVSDTVRQVMIDDGINPRRIRVVYSGVDVSRFGSTQDVSRLRAEMSLQPGQPVIGNIGRLEKLKGQAVLIEAMPAVLKEFPDATLLLVGGGEAKEELLAKCRELGIASSVVFTGFRDDIPELLRLLDVFVMPSLSEGLGTSVLDAMAAGVPVIASDVGGIPESVQNEVTGLLVAPGEPARLSVAVVRLLNNKTEACKYTVAARKTVEEKFGVDAMVEGNIRVYHEVLDTPRL